MSKRDLWEQQTHLQQQIQMQQQQFLFQLHTRYGSQDNQMEQLDASNGLLQPLAKESRRASTLNAVIHYEHDKRNLIRQRSSAGSYYNYSEPKTLSSQNPRKVLRQRSQSNPDLVVGFDWPIIDFSFDENISPPTEFSEITNSVLDDFQNSNPIENLIENFTGIENLQNQNLENLENLDNLENLENLDNLENLENLENHQSDVLITIQDEDNEYLPPKIDSSLARTPSSSRRYKPLQKSSATFQPQQQQQQFDGEQYHQINENPSEIIFSQFLPSSEPSLSSIGVGIESSLDHNKSQPTEQPLKPKKSQKSKSKTKSKSKSKSKSNPESPNLNIFPSDVESETGTLRVSIEGSNDLNGHIISNNILNDDTFQSENQLQFYTETEGNNGGYDYSNSIFSDQILDSFNQATLNTPTEEFKPILNPTKSKKKSENSSQTKSKTKSSSTSSTSTNSSSTKTSKSSSTKSSKSSSKSKLPNSSQDIVIHPPSQQEIQPEIQLEPQLQSQPLEIITQSEDSIQPQTKSKSKTKTKTKTKSNSNSKPKSKSKSKSSTPISSPNSSQFEFQSFSDQSSPPPQISHQQELDQQESYQQELPQEPFHEEYLHSNIVYSQAITPENYLFQYSPEGKPFVTRKRSNSLPTVYTDQSSEIQYPPNYPFDPSMIPGHPVFGMGMGMGMVHDYGMLGPFVGQYPGIMYPTQVQVNRERKLLPKTSKPVPIKKNWVFTFETGTNSKK